MKSFPFLGRVCDSLTTMKDSTFESKAYGKRVNKVISIEGRIQFDLLQVWYRHCVCEGGNGLERMGRLSARRGLNDVSGC